MEYATLGVLNTLFCGAHPTFPLYLLVGIISNFFKKKLIIFLIKKCLKNNY